MAEYLFALRGKLKSDLTIDELQNKIYVCALINHRNDLQHFQKLELEFVQVEEADYPKVNLEDV